MPCLVDESNTQILKGWAVAQLPEVVGVLFVGFAGCLWRWV